MLIHGLIEGNGESLRDSKEASDEVSLALGRETRDQTVTVTGVKMTQACGKLGIGKMERRKQGDGGGPSQYQLSSEWLLED